MEELASLFLGGYPTGFKHGFLFALAIALMVWLAYETHFRRKIITRYRLVRRRMSLRKARLQRYSNAAPVATG